MPHSVFKRILLVEDEGSVADFINKGLSEEKFEVSVAFNMRSALKMISENKYDLYILDIMLPDGNGLELCKTIRETDKKTPILFLTALGSSENIALGLNTGADDYLVKPFKFIELNARINALARRVLGNSGGTEHSPNTYTLADLTVNDDSKSVHRSGNEILLTATEYRLLLALLKNKGRVMSRTELLESAWDINFDLGTNVVDVYINYLRKKLDSDREPKLIHTVVGMGYVLKEK
jgi:DNA-binding response OmpR family regulator